MSSTSLPLRFRSSAGGFKAGNSSALALEPPGDDVTVISHVITSFLPTPPDVDVPPAPPLKVPHLKWALDASAEHLMAISKAWDSGPTAGVSFESTTVVDSLTTLFEVDGPDSTLALCLEKRTKFCTLLSISVLAGGIGGFEAEAEAEAGGVVTGLTSEVVVFTHVDAG